MQGADDEVVASLAKAVVPVALLSPAETALLQFVRTVTLQATRVTAHETEGLRELGWSDDQLAEAVYITALFAFFNRVADAFGLKEPGYLQLGEPLSFDDEPRE